VKHRKGGIQPLVEFETAGLQLSEADGETGEIRLEGVVAEVDTINRNRRYYSREVFENAVAQAEDLIEAGEFTGELDHPSTSALGTLERTAFVFNRLYLEDREVRFEARLLDTPAGQTLKSLLDGGVRVGMSTRGVGSVKWVEMQDGDGDKKKIAAIQDDYSMLGIDAVKVPSNRAGVVRLREHVEESIAAHIRNQSTQEEEDTMDIETLDQLREHFPELVQEAEDAVREQAASDVSTAEGRVEELQTELDEATTRATTLEGERDEAKEQLARVRTTLLGEEEEGDEGGELDEGLTVAVNALRGEVESLRGKLDEAEAAKATVELERALEARFDELCKASEYASVVREDIDATEYESVEALEAAFARTEKIAKRALGEGAGESRGKGHVHTEDNDTDDGGTYVTEEMLRLAGIKPASA